MGAFKLGSTAQSVGGVSRESTDSGPEILVYWIDDKIHIYWLGFVSGTPLTECLLQTTNGMEFLEKTVTSEWFDNEPGDWESWEVLGDAIDMTTASMRDDYFEYKRQIYANMLSILDNDPVRRAIVEKELDFIIADMFRDGLIFVGTANQTDLYF